MQPALEADRFVREFREKQPLCNTFVTVRAKKQTGFRDLIRLAFCVLESGVWCYLYFINTILPLALN
jgi:hypothetical protein